MPKVRKNEQAQQYEVMVDGQVAGYAQFRDQSGAVVMPHTVVKPEFEGQGLGGQLAEYALSDIRAAGKKVVPECPFIAGYIRKHPQYADLVQQ